MGSMFVGSLNIYQNAFILYYILCTSITCNKKLSGFGPLANYADRVFLLHVIHIPQKIEIVITTAVRTSHPTLLILFAVYLSLQC
jgi:hypothetical protein